MYIYGNLIGGLIGFIFGYLIGRIPLAIIGAIIGSSLLGRGFMQFRGRSGYNSRATGTGADNIFFVSLFSMLGKIAKADGVVSDSEMETVKQFMVRDLNLDPQLQSQALLIFNRSLTSPESFEQYAQQFYISFRNRPQFIELMLDSLLRVAYSDNIIHPAEKHLLESAVRIFQVNSYTFESIRNRYANGGKRNYSGGSSYQSSGNSAGSGSTGVSDLNYSILGCTRNSPDSDVKKAYRKKVSEFHPDKIAAKGLPQEFTKFANDKFREIQEAYENIKKERKF